MPMSNGHLLALVPDRINDNDLCHEEEVAIPDGRSLQKVPTENSIFQNIAAVQKVMVSYTETFPSL